MGSYRFILALFVAISHTPGSGLMSNLGASSVMCFYFISGWLMAYSFRQFEAYSPKPVFSFYKDRFIRLYPTYLAVMLVSLAVYHFVIGYALSPMRIAAELLLFPLGYPRLIGWEQGTVASVPTAWSLAVELHFYLALPFFLRASLKTRVAITFALCALHILAMKSARPLGYWLPVCPFREATCALPTSDVLGMDWPFLTSGIFFFGTLAHEAFMSRKLALWPVLVVYGAYLFTYLVWAPGHGWIFNPYNVYDILLGVSLLVPLATCIFLAEPRLRIDPQLDKILGNLAYPLFLSHFLGINLIVYFFGKLPDNRFVYVQCLAIAFALAVLFSLLQQKVVDPFRYWVRGFGERGARLNGDTLRGERSLA